MQFIFELELTDISCSVSTTLVVDAVRQSEDQGDRFIRYMCPNTLSHRVCWLFLLLNMVLMMPFRPYIPQQPKASYLPRDLLEGLEASLDNASQWPLVCCFVCVLMVSLFQTLVMCALFVLKS